MKSLGTTGTRYISTSIAMIPESVGVRYSAGVCGGHLPAVYIWRKKVPVSARTPPSQCFEGRTNKEEELACTPNMNVTGVALVERAWRGLRSAVDMSFQ